MLIGLLVEDDNKTLVRLYCYLIVRAYYIYYVEHRRKPVAKKMKSVGTISIDTAAGSRSYNRFDMQISQTLHIAIELYEDINYLLILDHYDDITVFNLDAEPLVVSYYQMKTSENIMTIDSAIEKNWIAKLYAQLNRPDNWLVKELGLITNVPLEVQYKIGGNSKIDKLTAEHTPFTKLNQIVQDRIRTDIAEKFGINQADVDISKFAHLRTTLSITNHRDLTEKEMSDFLYAKYPKITVETVKGIYAAMLDLLSKRQAYETLPSDAEFSEVMKHKGVTRDEFSRVIDQAIVFGMPEFSEVEDYIMPAHKERAKISLAYVTLNGDRIKRNNQSFYTLFTITQNCITNEPYDGKKSIMEYGRTIAEKIREDNPLLCAPYDDYYVIVLITCLLINSSRR